MTSTLSGAPAIADAVLYEGYSLYPYRPSALKNQYRWTFGVVRPAATAARWETSELACDCLVEGPDTLQLEGWLRFLVPNPVTIGDGGGAPNELAAACEVAFGPIATSELGGGVVRHRFAVRGGSVQGFLELLTQPIAPGVARLRAHLVNTSPIAGENVDDDLVNSRSMVSAQVILRVSGGDFVPLRDPPLHLIAAADACESAGWWPMLVGTAPRRDTVLLAPICLDDYPEVAGESPGELFDNTEIDEILTLRIQTLTEAEKQEMGAADPRVRAVLERAESLGEDLGKLHGVVRTRRSADGAPLKPGDRVTVHPRRRSDIFDLALAGRAATVVSIANDYDGRRLIAVTIDDDPGPDLGATGMPGHRFFFGLDEVRPVGQSA